MAGTTGAGNLDRGGKTPPEPILADLYRLIDGMFQIGWVVEADGAAGKVRVGVGDPDLKTSYYVTDWIPWRVNRAGNNSEWIDYELGEQVLLACPSGLVQNAVIIGALNQQYRPHDSQFPYIEKKVWRDAPQESPIKMTTPVDGNDPLPYYAGSTEQLPTAAMIEHNRATGLYRHWLRESGTFRFEISKGEAVDGNSLFSSITMDKDHIELKVQDTKLVIDKDGIKADIQLQSSSLYLLAAQIFAQVGASSFAGDTPAPVVAAMQKMAGPGAVIPGTEVEKGVTFLLDKTQMVAAVKNNGTLRVAEDTISAKIADAQAHFKMTRDAIVHQVQTGFSKVTAAIASLGVPGSAIEAAASTVSISSPGFAGIPISFSPPAFDAIPNIGKLTIPAPRVSFIPPIPTVGLKPFKPF